jgi:hypothetical protein
MLLKTHKKLVYLMKSTFTPHSQLLLVPLKLLIYLTT